MAGYFIALAGALLVSFSSVSAWAQTSDWEADYVALCLEEGYNARLDNPDLRFPVGLSVESHCECRYQTLEATGLTREEFIIANEEAEFLTKELRWKPSNAEILRVVLASARRLERKLGNERFNLYGEASIKALRCPGSFGRMDAAELDFLESLHEVLPDGLRLP